MFELMLGLTEVPEAWGGAPLGPADGGVTNVSGRAGLPSCSLHRDQVKASRMAGTRTTALAMLLPPAQPEPPVPCSSFLQVIHTHTEPSNKEAIASAHCYV